MQPGVNEGLGARGAPESGDWRCCWWREAVDRARGRRDVSAVGDARLAVGTGFDNCRNDRPCWRGDHCWSLAASDAGALGTLGCLLVVAAVAMMRISRCRCHCTRMEQRHKLATHRRGGDQEKGGEPVQGPEPGEHPQEVNGVVSRVVSGRTTAGLGLRLGSRSARSATRTSAASTGRVTSRLTSQRKWSTPRAAATYTMR